MKTKGWSHAHFIQTICGGLVVKVPSIGSHGDPEIRFKRITDIYESEDTEKLYSGLRFATHKQRSTRSPRDNGNIEVEKPLEFVVRKTVGIEHDYETSMEGDKEISTSDVDDDALGSMTLKQIKERRKTKKRQFPRSLDLVKQDLRTCSDGGISSNKQGCSVQWKEDAELDGSLNGPLRSKKLKTKMSTIASGDCAPPESPIFVDASTEQILNYQSSSHNTVEMHGPFDPHIESMEPLEPDNLNSQNGVPVADGSTCGSNVKMSYAREHFDEFLKGVDSGASDTRESFSLSKEICVLNTVSYEYLEPSNFFPLASATENFGETMKVGSPEIHKALHRQRSSPIDVFPVTSNPGSKEDPNIQEGMLPCDTLTQLSDMTLKSSSKSKVICYGTDRSIPGINDDTDNNELASDFKPKVVESKSLTYNLDMVATEALKPMELSNGGNGCTLSVDGEVNNTKNINPDLGPTATSSSSNDISPTAAQKHSMVTRSESLFGCLDVAPQGFSDICSSDATKGRKDVEALEGFLCVKTENPPKKLLSTRKAISPTSQEKLCRELNAGGLCDNMETFKCREKLFVEKQTESNNCLTKSSVEGGDVSIKPKQVIKKLSNNHTGTPQQVPRGILKASPVSFPKPSSHTECASVYTCAEKAIEFSQRQMRDIENLAVKLMKELKSVKGIVEDTFCHEVCQEASAKYTPDQVKSAIKDMAGAEETTEKWLSMMARDCTRFCKIMKSTQKKSLLEKKKNITFADEAGGVLCHVKVYEDPQHPEHEMRT